MGYALDGMVHATSHFVLRCRSIDFSGNLGLVLQLMICRFVEFKGFF